MWIIRRLQSHDKDIPPIRLSYSGHMLQHPANIAFTVNIVMLYGFMLNTVLSGLEPIIKHYLNNNFIINV